LPLRAEAFTCCGKRYVAAKALNEVCEAWSIFSADGAEIDPESAERARVDRLAMRKFPWARGAVTIAARRGDAGYVED
jgi:hypothetical protein